MNDSYRKTVMKLVAAAGIFSSIYPVVIVLRAVFFGYAADYSSLFFGTVLNLAGLGAGYVLMRDETGRIKRFMSHPTLELMLGDSISTRTVGKLLAGISIIIPAAAAAIVYWKQGMIRTSFEIPIAVVLYMTGLRNSIIEFDTIISGKYMYTTGVMLLGLSMIVPTYFIKEVQLKDEILIFASMFIISAMLVRNQSNLDSILVKKGNAVGGVPKNTRKFNVMFVLLFFLFIVLFLNLKAIILFALNVCGIILKFMIWAFIKIISLLSPKGGKPGSGQADNIPFTGGGGEPSNPLFDMVLRILVTFITLFGLYRYAYTIVSLIKKALSALVKFIRGLFGNYIDVLPEGGSSDYSDEIEMVKPVDSGINRKAVRKKIRSLHKNLRKINDPIEKVRHIYNLVLFMLIRKDVEIGPGDTTGQIYRKSLGISGAGTYLKEITAVYDEVRYGEKIPGTQKISEIENNFAGISEALKDVRNIK